MGIVVDINCKRLQWSYVWVAILIVMGHVCPTCANYSISNASVCAGGGTSSGGTYTLIGSIGLSGVLSADFSHIPYDCANTSVSSDLVACWQMKDNRNSTWVQDCSGNDNSADLNVYTNSVFSSDYSGCLDIPMLTASDTPFDFSSEFTISFWMEPDTVNYYGSIISKFQSINGDDTGFYVGVNTVNGTSKLVFFACFESTGGYVLKAWTEAPTSLWFDGSLLHVVAIANSDGVILRLNDSVQYSSSINAGFNGYLTNDTALTMLSGTSFNGRFQKVRFYDRTLTSAEITAIYNEECPE